VACPNLSKFRVTVVPQLLTGCSGDVSHIIILCFDDGLAFIRGPILSRLVPFVFPLPLNVTCGFLLSSVKKICVRTHQVLGMLWTHPVSAHTTPNTKRTGNVNSDAAHHGTVHPDADRHGICLPDRAWQGIFLRDTLCQGIFLLDAAESGHFPSGCSCVRAFSYWTRPDDACHGSTVTLAVKARNIAANTRVAFANTQQVPGIVTQSSPILYIYGMYIYICYYTLCVSSKSTQRHTHRCDNHIQ